MAGREEKKRKREGGRRTLLGWFEAKAVWPRREEKREGGREGGRRTLLGWFESKAAFGRPRREEKREGCHKAKNMQSVTKQIRHNAKNLNVAQFKHIAAQRQFFSIGHSAKSIFM